VLTSRTILGSICCVYKDSKLTREPVVVREFDLVATLENVTMMFKVYDLALK